MNGRARKIAQSWGNASRERTSHALGVDVLLAFDKVLKAPEGQERSNLITSFAETICTLREELMKVALEKLRREITQGYNKQSAQEIMDGIEEYATHRGNGKAKRLVLGQVSYYQKAQHHSAPASASVAPQ